MVDFKRKKGINRALLSKIQLTIDLLLLSTAAAASETSQDFQTWNKIDVTGAFSSAAPDWRYEASTENRNQQIRPEVSAGYRASPLVSFWSGFTWITPNNGSPQIYRPFQQVIWELLDKNPNIIFQTRTRLEQYKEEGQPEWAWRLRERWRFAFPNKMAKKFTPVIYDEVFFNLNQPNWVSQGALSQNRLFIGIDSPPWKNTFIEIGYINRYVFNKPVGLESHILSVSFMIFLR